MLPPATRGKGDRVQGEELLLEIADYCRLAGMAETTFGRLAVNDGKLVGRLRLGGRVTGETAARVRAFIGAGEARQETAAAQDTPAPMVEPKRAGEGAERAFRFYDCLLYTSPSPRDLSTSRMPSSA